jgi:hypothetical protein
LKNTFDKHETYICFLMNNTFIIDCGMHVATSVKI